MALPIVARIPSFISTDTFLAHLLGDLLHGKAGIACVLDCGPTVLALKFFAMDLGRDHYGGFLHTWDQC